MSEVKLTTEQNDFICHKLALFITHRRIAQAIFAKYPELKLNEDELIRKIRYLATHKNAVKWQQRTSMYREVFNTNLKNRFTLTNPFARLRKLEKIVKESLKPHLSHVVYYPNDRGKEEKQTFTCKEVHKPDTTAALKAMAMIRDEMISLGGKAGLPSSVEFDGLSDDDMLKIQEDQMEMFREFRDTPLEEEP